jgi:hypothetical protein
MPDWRSPPGGDGRGETVDNPNYSPTLPAYRKNFDAAQSPLAARNMLGLKTITENINGLSVVQGNILYGSSADTIALLAKDTNATRYLSNTGASNNPAWAQVDLTNGVTGTLGTTNGGTGGTLPVANGGTGLTTIPWPVANGCNGVASLPSFSVGRGFANQTINTATETKIEFNSELWDTGSYFDSATNYRYTPLVAGTYIFTAAVALSGLTVGTLSYLVLYKNGAAYEYGNSSTVSTSGNCAPCGTWLVQMNGSTDYVEFYIFHNEGVSALVLGTHSVTHASGAWLAP